MQYSRNLRRRWRFNRQQLVVGVSLVGFLVAVIGVPLPVYQFKATGRPYPCMGHACGCQDADHCWRDCCCFTQAEKLAWAKAHGVTPPSFMLAAAEHEEHEHEHEHDQDHDHESAVTKVAAASCCSAVKTARRSCCQAAAKCCEASGETHVEESKESAKAGLRFAVMNNFRQCRGLPQLWSVLGASTAPPSAIHYAFNWQVVDWLSLHSITADSCAAAPPTPPPLG